MSKTNDMSNHKKNLDDCEAEDLIGSVLLRSINAAGPLPSFHDYSFSAKNNLKNCSHFFQPGSDGEFPSLNSSWPNEPSPLFAYDPIKSPHSGHPQTLEKTRIFLGSQIFDRPVLKSSPKKKRSTALKTSSFSSALSLVLDSHQKFPKPRKIQESTSPPKPTPIKSKEFSPGKGVTSNLKVTFKPSPKTPLKTTQRPIFSPKTAQNRSKSNKLNSLRSLSENKSRHEAKFSFFAPKKEKNRPNLAQTQNSKTTEPFGFGNLAIEEGLSSNEEDETSSAAEKGVAEKKPCEKHSSPSTPAATENGSGDNKKQNGHHPPSTEKKTANETLWSFDEITEKQNIHNFWAALSAVEKMKLTSVAKAHIVHLLTKHVRLNCSCGDCSWLGSKIYGGLSAVYDSFYEQLDGKISEELGLSQGRDAEESLRVEIGSRRIDEQFLDDSGPYYIGKVALYLCKKTQRRRKRLLAQQEIDSPLSLKEKQPYSGAISEVFAVQQNDTAQHRPDDHILEEKTKSFYANSLHDDSVAISSDVERFTRDLANFSAYAAKQIIGEVDVAAFLNVVGLQNDHPIAQAFRNPVSEEDVGAFTPPGFLQRLKSRIGADGRVGESQDDGYERMRERLFELLLGYAPENTQRVEMAMRIEALLFFLNNSYGLMDSVRHRQEVGLKALELYQREQQKFGDCGTSSTEKLRRLNLRQAHLSDQQRLIDQHIEEHNAVQREVFRQLLHLFDVFIFGPPLDTLGPGERAALLIDFRQFSIIDEELYEQLLSEKYPAVFAGAREAAERESVASDEYSDTSEGSGESDGAEESVFFGNKIYGDCCEMIRAFAVKLFHQRVLRAYLETVSEKKQKALIEEEEEERKLSAWRQKKKKEKRKERRRARKRETGASRESK